MRTGYAGRRRASVTRPALIMAMIVVAAVLGAMSSEAAPLTTYYDVSVSTQYENWYGPGYRPDGSLGEPYGIFGGATALHGTGMLSWLPDSASFAFDAGGVYGGFSFDGTSWSPAGGFVPGYVPGPADFRTDWGSIGTGSGSINEQTEGDLLRARRLLDRLLAPYAHMCERLPRWQRGHLGFSAHSHAGTRRR